MSPLHPDNSDSASISSESTIEDVDLSACNFGYPLERTPGTERTEQEAALLIEFLGQMVYNNSSASSSESDLSTTSSVIYNIDFEALIDELTIREPLIAKPDSFTFIEPSSNNSNDSIMIKCLLRTSPELVILLELNHSDLRSDPWNPVPHILRGIERSEKVFLCMERLVEFDQPPFKTVANYTDFFRQILEGLSFLHEHGIGQLSCFDPRSFMVALGVCPSSLEQFDRTLYPVRYYFIDFSKAVQIEYPKKSFPAIFRKDVQDCGRLIDQLLADVPLVRPKLMSLVKAMTSGEFTAEDARKLLEALCKSLESSVLDTLVPINHERKRRTTVSADGKFLCL